MVLLWGLLLVSATLDLRAMVSLSDAPLPAPGLAPEVLVIVPARNEAHQIAACLRSLGRLRGSAGWLKNQKARTR